MPVVSYATSNRDKLTQAEREKKELEAQQKKIDEEKDKLEKEQKGLKKELGTLNAQLQEVSDYLEELENKISDKEQEILETEAALAEARATEEWQYECMKIRIQFMYEQSDHMYLDFLFSAKSFADFIDFNEYAEALTRYDKKMLTEYEENRMLIEDEEAKLNQEKIELDGYKVEAEITKNRVAGLISQTAGNIAQKADEIADAEDEYRAYEADIKKKEEDINYLNKLIAEEMRLSREAANAAWRDISEVSFADGDRRLLANIIYCEAGGEEYAGKLAVGAVVINRVLSSKYPDTVVGVVYQNKQFSPVASGRLALALATDKATQSCYQAADEAMSGVTNVGTCLYFRTPIEGLTGISIGGHIFY